MKRIVNIIIFFLLFVISVTFAFFNFTTVKVHYLFGETMAPLVVVILLTLIVGSIIGVLFSIWMSMHMRMDLSRSKKEIKLLRQELDNLRTIPLKDRQ